MRLIIIILLFLLYQTNLYSKASQTNEFNQKYLSSYFSALVSYDNQNNDVALKFFNSSKSLMKKHDNFLKEYVFSLVLDGQVKKAIDQIKISKNEQNSDFFEANLLLTLDSFKKKKFKKVSKKLKKLETLKDNGTYEYVIYKILESYNKLYLYKKIDKENENFGNLSLITNAFQNCYLNSEKTSSHFINLINSEQGDYSRYLFFYFSNLIQNDEFDTAIAISKTIHPLSGNLLISQAKKWIDEKKYKKFNDYFSCKNENDILSEFFFLISNLFSSQEMFEHSNFYLSISNYLNSEFYFNSSLLVENFYFNDNLDLAIKTLENFNKEDEVYNWYKTKQIGKIISERENDEASLNYVEKKFKLIKNPSIKELYDFANIYKKFEKYNKAIEYYSKVLLKVDKNSLAHSKILYRRGSCFERIKNYNKADIDLLNSIEINPDDAYTLNYLAYSWLERNYKIDEAIKMLQKAYKKKENDPYITDSVGWGYYLIGDYINAEKYLKKAVKLMPDDPIVNDHYGDVLWQLNRKLQAKYFWKNVLDLEETEEEMKKNIRLKLLNGLEKT